MKKITILALHLGFGGIEKYIATLCEMLCDDYQIEIISTYKKDEKPAFKFSNKVSITYLMDDVSNRQEFKESFKNKKYITTVKEGCKALKILHRKKSLNIKAIKSLDTDYVITTRDFHNKLVNKYCPKGIIKIATDHNYHNDDQEYIRYLKNTVSHFDYFVCISKKLYKDYKEIMKPKCVYIPNVINKNNTRTKLNSNDLITVGRLEKVKGFDDLLKVAKILKNKNDNFIWHIVGDGSLYETLKKNIKLYQLDKNIILHGYLNQENIALLYNKSLLYVMTSYSESFGIVLLEAMSHGLPCISFSSAYGAKEVINNNKLIIENRDLEAMANLIDHYLTNKEELKSIGEDCLKRCEEYYLDDVKKQWIKLLGDKNE